MADKGDRTESLLKGRRYAKILELGIPAIYRLAHIVSEGEPRLQQPASNVLARFGEPAIPALLSATENTTIDGIERIFETLQKIGDKGIEAIAKSLESEYEEVRMIAAWKLGAIRPVSAVLALARAMAEAPDYETRKRSKQALIAIGSPAIPALRERLHAGPSVGVYNAIEALGKIRDPSVIPDLLDLGSRHTDAIAEKVAEALENLECREAEEFLIRALEKRIRIRLAAIKSLGKIGTVQAIEGLEICLGSDNLTIRNQAYDALEKILDRCRTTEELERYEKGLDEGLTRLQRRFRDDDLVGIGFGIAGLKKQVAATKNDLASNKDLILEDIPKPPPKDKGRMYQQLRRNRTR